MAKTRKPITKRGRKPVRRIGRRANDPPVRIPQDAEVVDRSEYLVRILRTHLREVKVFATSADVASELAANGLGVVTDDVLMYTETKSVNQIG